MFSLCPQAVFAEGTADSAAMGGLCEHHSAHDESCGYTEGTPGTPCTHEHTDECYTEVTNCIHEHTEDCYPAEDVSGNTAIPSEADKAEPTECSHVCSEESGCITRELNCQHEHSEDCGYSPAIEGTPCDYVCALCNSQDSGPTSGQSGQKLEDELVTPSNAVTAVAFSNTQTENSVAKVGSVYYDDLAEALSNAKGQTCDILKDTSLSGTFDFTGLNDAVTINLNGHTISGSSTLILGGMTGSYINGPGTINGTIGISQGYLVAPLTVNGNITQPGVALLEIEGTGVLRVNGNIDNFTQGANISDGVTIVCTGTCSETDIQDRVITQPKNITLKADPEGSGSVTALGNKVVMDSGNAIASAGSTVTLSAVPNQGYQFKEWKVEPVGTTISNNTFIMPNNDVAVTAVFEKLQKPSSVTVTVQKGNSPTTEADYGDTIDITAAVAEARTNTYAAANQVEFFVGTDNSKKSLGTANVSGNQAALSVTLSGTDWEKGWAIGSNTITAEYGGSDTMTGSSGTATLTVKKAEQTGKPTVSVSETTTNSIAVTASGSGQGDYEYACVEGESASAPAEGWQITNIFSNLLSGTAYTVFARFAGNEYYKPSPASDGVTAYTVPATPEASAVTINYETETVSFDSSTLEVNTTSDFNGVNIKSGESIANYIENTNQTIYVRVKANGNIPASAEQTVTIPSRPAAPENVTAVDEKFQGEKGKITGVTTAMEYKADEKEQWINCGGKEVALPAGTYQVRIKATANSFASRPVEVEIKAGVPRTYTLNITAPVFDSVREGYGKQDAKALTIASTGNSDTTVTGVSLSGEGAKAFTLNKTDGTIVSAGQTDNTTYTIQPKTRLSVGTYTATVTVSYHDKETASEEVSFKVLRRWEPSRPTDGLHPDSNGDLWCYKDGRIDKTFEGMVTYDGSQFYVKDGKVQKIDGLKLVKETWYFLTKGRVQTQHTGLVQYDGEWFYVTKAILDTTISGVIPYDGGEFVFTQGRLIQELNGLWLNPGDNTWYFIANGQVQRNYTGLALYDGHWFHVVDGIFDQTYTGLVIYNNAWFYVTKGELNTTISGVVPYNGGTFIFTAGRLANEANGLWLNPKDKKWYFASNGQIQTQYTGVAMYDNEWFYIRKGTLASDYTGTIQYNGATFRVQSGQLYEQTR